MGQDVKASLLRFPHVESLIDETTELSDGAIFKSQASPEQLGKVDLTGIDVWEVPLVKYIAGRDNDFDVTAIPVFTTRRFIQWMIEVPENSEIRNAKDLEGKRILERYHGNTDIVWTKGLLEESYDVDLSGVQWYSIGREPVPGHQAPEGVVCLNGADPDELLTSGFVDAFFNSGHGDSVAPGVRRLWVESEREAAEWYKSCPVFPILHTVVVRNSAIAEHPSLARDLYQVFEKAKNEALVRWDYGASLPEEKRAVALWSGFPGSAWGGSDRSFLDRDPIPYGLDLPANRDALQRLIRYAFQQAATHRAYAVQDLFVSVE